jgi:uncharacterized protein
VARDHLGDVRSGGIVRSVRSGFFSDSFELDCVAYYPDGAGPFPVVLACSGFLGLYRIHPERFARKFAASGIATVSFDYRGYGASQGPRNRVIIEEQIRDIRAAATFALSLEDVDRSAMYLLGWALGGGLVIDASRELPHVRGLIAINGLYDGLAFLKAHRSDDELDALRREADDDRLARCTTGKLRFVDPFHIYPLDDETLSYVRANLDTVTGYESQSCSLEFFESLLRWSVLPTAGQISTPLLAAHGDSNLLHPSSQLDMLVECYGGPTKVHWMQGSGHTEWMADENPTFVTLADTIATWITEASSK